MPTATVSQLINGMYVVLYNRASDGNGGVFWAQDVGLTRAQSISTIATGPVGPDFNNPNTSTKLATDFVSTQSTYFNATYGGLSDDDFITALYTNLGGNAIVAASDITFWKTVLAGFGNDRVKLIGKFVFDFLTIDLTNRPPDDPAVIRQQTFFNKVIVSQAYELTTSPSLIPASASNSDPAFVAVTRAIQGVTNSAASVNTAIS